MLTFKARSENDRNMKADYLMDAFEQQLNRVEAKLDRRDAASKAAAILAGVHADGDNDPYRGPRFLRNLAAWKLHGDYDAMAAAKAVLATSDATGLAIVPNAFVADVVERVSIGNPWRRALNVVSGVRGLAVEIPYENTAIENAMLQGGAAQSYGSNKDIRDFTLGTVTATLYTIAQIVDVGNQLLRSSEGAAESLVRSRLARSFARAEASFITAGTGTSQPFGLVPAFGAYGGTAFDTALNSESRAAAIGRALGALEARGATDGLSIAMAPADFWELATETLGSSGSGGWALDPTAGPTQPRVTLWGVPVFRDATLTAGTCYVGAFKQMDFFVGDELRIDVSDTAGSRFDTNVTGFRGETSIAWDARPYVFNGWVQRVTGL